MKRTFFVLVLMVLVSLTIVTAYPTENMDFGECRLYYLPNTTGNITTYNAVRVCAPEFPRINQQVTLDKENPLFVLPQYNFSANINPEVYQVALDVEQNLSELSNKLNNLDKDLQDYKQKNKESLDNLNKNLNNLKGSLEEKINNNTASLESRIVVLENRVRKGGGVGLEVVIAVVLIIIMGIAWVFYRKGSLSKYVVSSPQEWETQEPEKKPKRPSKTKK